MNSVLISSAASPTGSLLAAHFARAGETVVGIDTQPAQFRHGTFVQCPRSDDTAAYDAFLRALIELHGISRAFFCNDHDLAFLAAQDEASPLPTLGVPAASVVRRFLDKQISAESAAVFLDVPRIVAPDEQPTEGKFFMRNRKSTKRPKLMRVVDAADLRAMSREERESLIVTALLNGEEYTADTFYDPARGICETAIRERVVVEGGVCTMARLIDEPELTRRLEAFVRDNDIVGFSCTQFIRAEGRYQYIETNTRAGGGTSISLRAGLGERIAGGTAPLRYGELIRREHEDDRV